MAFKNDTRGIGGQKQIMNLMQNHYSALLNVKPTINTRVAPAKHVKARPLSSMQQRNNIVDVEQQLYSAPQYAEQREAFKRVAALKSGYIDHKAPDTYYRAHKMVENKKAKMLQSSYQQHEHMKNLASLQRRILDVGSKQDRKKNPFDPLGNPVFFFTKGTAAAEKSISLNGFAKRVERRLEERHDKVRQTQEQFMLFENNSSAKKRPISAYIR